MKLYTKEILDGLSEKIQNSGSIAFEMDILPECDILGQEKLNKCIASLQNQEDYGLVWSILVSTTVNKNDDYFGKSEVWAAKETPINKPCNIDHNENDIVGHIHSCFPVDNEYSPISLDTDPESLPDLYHLLVSSVVYNQWSKPENQDRVSNLMKEISSGERKVSMECVFKGFDYAILAPDGKFHYIDRNESNAFLTKHLRAYGGTGEYQDHKVFRYLKNLSFSGKGFVLRPANPYSIILNTPTDNSDNSTSSNILVASENSNISSFSGLGVNLNKNLDNNGDNIMSDTQEVQVDINQLENDLATAKALATEYETKIQSLEASVVEKDNHLQAMMNDYEQMKNALKTCSEERETMQGTVQKYMDEAKKMYRMGKMKERYVMSEMDMEDKYNVLSALNDDQFDAVMSLTPMLPKAECGCGSQNKVEEAPAQQEEASVEEVAASEIVETVVASDLNETISPAAQETDEIAPVRESLRAWAEHIVNKK
jgi:hypothetical protein